MISAVAGTFNILHSGHKELIRKAFEIGDEILIGVTGDGMASSERNEIIPFYIRKRELELFLSTMKKPWRIMEIKDIYGPRELMDEAEILIVSEETFKNGLAVNEDRESRGIKPLELYAIPMTKASDGTKISSSCIMEGKYARSGKIDAIDVVVGSANRVKVEAVRAVLERIYGDVKITAISVDSGVPPQPSEGDTRKGAVNRAKGALGTHDMSFGIEAGVFETEDGLYDIQYCAILDKMGILTVGMGSGFRYPDDISELVRKGYTVGDAVKKTRGDSDIGKKQGAIGILSDGLMDRKSLTEQSVLAAMIPRMKNYNESKDRSNERM
jgi:inosine/xanthosine triphosphatase